MIGAFYGFLCSSSYSHGQHPTSSLSCPSLASRKSWPILPPAQSLAVKLSLLIHQGTIGELVFTQIETGDSLNKNCNQIQGNRNQHLNTHTTHTNIMPTLTSEYPAFLSRPLVTSPTKVKLRMTQKCQSSGAAPSLHLDSKELKLFVLCCHCCSKHDIYSLHPLKQPAFMTLLLVPYFHDVGLVRCWDWVRCWET